MGRRQEFDLKVMVRVTEDLPGRIKAVLRPKENMAGFFRATATRELERRERAAAKAPEPKRGRRAA
jgi:hypothetical protein